MGLTSGGFLAVLLVATAAAITATMLLWDRWWRPARFGLRLLSLLVLMGLGTLVAGDQINRSYGLYGSFSELVGNPTVQLHVASTRPVTRLQAEVVAAARRTAARGRGVVLRWRFVGHQSGITRGGYVYLPAAYFERTHPTERFPVVELFHGYPGSPHIWLDALHLARNLDTEIASGRIPALIAVAPANYSGYDGECVNAVGGQRNETFLAVDVPANVLGQLRALDTPGGWAAMGYSTGGFCAVNLALHHPERYAAAVSLSGYFTALTDRTTGDLYHRDRAARLKNSPQWLVRHHDPAPSLYLFASGDDRQAVAQVRAFAAALPPTDPPTVVVAAHGGHNFMVWNAASIAAFDWLASHLIGPSSPPVVISPTTAPITHR